MVDVELAGRVRALLTAQQSGRTGALEIRAPEGVTIVYFHAGRAVFAEEGTLGETLGRLLVQQGRLTQEQYARVIDHMTERIVHNETMRFGEAAIELGLLTADQVHDALADQVKRKIGRALRWEHAAATFREASDALDGLARFPCTIEPVVLEVCREHFDRNRLQTIVGPALTKRWIAPPAVAVAERFGATPADLRVVRTLDGSQTLAECLSAHGDDLALPIAAALVLTGALELQPPPTGRVSTPIAIRDTSPGTAHAPTPPAAPAAAPAVARGATPAATAPAAAAAPQVPTPAMAAVVAPAKSTPRPRRDTPTTRIPHEAPTTAQPRDVPATTLPRDVPATTQPRDVPATAQPRDVPATTQPRDEEREAEARRRAAAAAASLWLGRRATAAADPRRARVEAEQAFQRGRRFVRDGNFARAEPELRRAVELFPEADEYQLYVAFVELRRATDDQTRAKLLPGVAKRVRAVLKRDSNLAFAHYVDAHLALADSDLTRAERCFRTTLRLDPTEIDAERQLRLLASRNPKPKR